MARMKRSTRFAGTPEHHKEQGEKAFETMLKAADRVISSVKKGSCGEAQDQMEALAYYKGQAVAQLDEAGEDYFDSYQDEAIGTLDDAEFGFYKKCLVNTKGLDREDMLSGAPRRRRRR